MKHALLIAGVAALAAGSSASAQSLQPIHADPAATAPPGSTEIAQLSYPAPEVVPEAPPPPRAETPPPPPPLAPGAIAYVWQPGRWAWTGASYVWVQGRYVESPRVTAQWVPGHWQRRGAAGWEWVDGRWSYATEGQGR